MRAHVRPVRSEPSALLQALQVSPRGQLKDAENRLLGLEWRISHPRTQHMAEHVQAMLNELYVCVRLIDGVGEAAWARAIQPTESQARNHRPLSRYLAVSNARTTAATCCEFARDEMRSIRLDHLPANSIETLQRARQHLLKALEKLEPACRVSE